MSPIKLVKPGVDLELPIVAELIGEYGPERLSYVTGAGEKKKSSVTVAFIECPDLTFIGRHDPSALRAAIESAIAEHNASN